MTCIHLTVLFFSLSACHQEPPRRLPGLWVGTMELGEETRFVRAEFIPGRREIRGRLELDGARALTLVRASENDGSVAFEMSDGDDELLFVGAFEEDSIVGRVHYAGEQVLIELHRVPEPLPAFLSSHDTPLADPR